MSAETEAEAEAEYFSKDFEWETLRQEIEDKPSYQYHLLPFTYTPPSQQQEIQVSEDSKAWKRFHLRHSSGKFFKERRYLLKEFPELVSCKEFSKVLEVGCGNGSSVIPILRSSLENVLIFVATRTLSYMLVIVAVRLLRGLKRLFIPRIYLQSKIVSTCFFCDFAFTGFPKWFVCDSCVESFSLKQQEHSSGWYFFLVCLFILDYCNHRYISSWLILLASSDVKEGVADTSGSYLSRECGCCIGGVDFVSLIFTLSAVPQKKMSSAIKECFSVLKPGGLLLFRDYGLYDMTMLRFEQEKRVGFREYMRSDGTRSYFFCLDTVRDLFLELEYCCVKSVNRRKGKSMQRVWVHAKFQKPA
ncbi:tRNA N(3)-methylcytidine methyltransferase METTL6 [Populus alba x Populus x berolinensis]|uniref:tRNA N(3)-methylcytidine methyltransferase n=1 Tax=Populus alba x Populus x berolinensis TaxID=444605 RepID=A0AAD6Q0R9_9ROSI|nr:tRNA N(3)-methylcytidine methyltransferase METTL6 [Populus alba x Populus x berolinensis]